MIAVRPPCLCFPHLAFLASCYDCKQRPQFPPLPPGLDEAMVLTGHRTVFCGIPMSDFDKIYDKLARRLYVSRDFVKRMTYMIGYGGKVDPWIKHLIETEIEIIMQETP